MVTLSPTVSVFSLIALGYIVSRTRVLGTEFEAVLSGYVYYLALPAEVFMATARLQGESRQDMLGYLSCYAMAILILWLMIVLLYGGVFKRPRREVGLDLLVVGQTNTAFLAVPIFLYVFGNASLVVPVILLQPLVLTSLAIFLIEFEGKVGGFSFALLLKKILSISSRNPLILAALLGLLVSILGLPLRPVGMEFPEETIASLGSTASPVALLAMGASFHVGGSRLDGLSEKAEVYAGVFLKCIVHPFLSFLLGLFVFRLDIVRLSAVTLVSAMPSPKNTFILARVYGLPIAKYNFIWLWTTGISFLAASGLIFLFE